MSSRYNKNVLYTFQTFCNFVKMISGKQKYTSKYRPLIAEFLTSILLTNMYSQKCVNRTKTTMHPSGNKDYLSTEPLKVSSNTKRTNAIKWHVSMGLRLHQQCGQTLVIFYNFLTKNAVA